MKNFITENFLNFKNEEVDDFNIREELKERKEHLSQCQIGSKEYAVVSDSIVKLVAMDKVKKEAADRNKSTWAKVVIDGVVGIGGILLTIGAINSCLKFEETGVVASSTSKSVLGSILRFKV